MRTSQGQITKLGERKVKITELTTCGSFLCFVVSRDFVLHTM
jgi:hypothetical protein